MENQRNLTELADVIVNSLDGGETWTKTTKLLAPNNLSFLSYKKTSYLSENLKWLEKKREKERILLVDFHNKS